MYPSTRQKTTWIAEAWIAEAKQHLTQNWNGFAASRLDFGTGQIEGDDRRKKIETLDLPADAAYPRTPITKGNVMPEQWP